MNDQANFGNTGGKKAVHVKWAGKTIALGTFPAAEGDEKCARAKALTRAWRSTMRPKPSREWVMLELERLGVRVVSGRPGRKAGEEDEPEKKPAEEAALNTGVGGGAVHDRSNSLGWASELNSLMQRRSSSLGLGAMFNDSDAERRRSIGSLSQVVGLDGNVDASLLGGANAFSQNVQKNEQVRRASSLGLGGIGGAAGNLGGSGVMQQIGLSGVNPNQHYEMLKMHHMNLLNEIQETTLMMKMYEQQQLQQQQQQVEQQANADQLNNNDSQMALLLQQQQHNNANQNSMDQLFGGGGFAQQRGSMGFGASIGGGQQSQSQQIEQLLRQQQLMQAGGGGSAAAQAEFLKGQQEQAALNDQLQKLKNDIARRQKEAEFLQSKGDGGDKRKRDGGIGDHNQKIPKMEQL